MRPPGCHSLSLTEQLHLCHPCAIHVPPCPCSALVLNLSVGALCMQQEWMEKGPDFLALLLVGAALLLPSQCVHLELFPRVFHGHSSKMFPFLLHYLASPPGFSQLQSLELLQPLKWLHFYWGGWGCKWPEITRDGRNKKMSRSKGIPLGAIHFRATGSIKVSNGRSPLCLFTPSLPLLMPSWTDSPL